MAVYLYSDSIMYDRHDTRDANDTDPKKTDDKDRQLEHTISRNKVHPETEEISINETSSLDKEGKPDEDAVQEQHKNRKKSFDLNLGKMRYQTLYRRAVCYSKMEQYDLCIQV